MRGALGKDPPDSLQPLQTRGGVSLSPVWEGTCGVKFDPHPAERSLPIAASDLWDAAERQGFNPLPRCASLCLLIRGPKVRKPAFHDLGEASATPSPLQDAAHATLARLQWWCRRPGTDLAPEKWPVAQRG